MKFVFWLLFIVGIIFLIVIIKKFKTPRLEYLNLISGGIGGGKSSSAVCRIKSMLRRFYFLFRNRKIKNDYIIFSSVPLGKLSRDKSYRYIKIFNHKIKCYDLTLDVLTLQKRLPQNEVILYIDEFSNIASQFDYNNPIISDNINEFFRNFRHYTNGLGYIFAIDQCSQNIFLQVRRRANYCYSMVSCKKIKFLPIMIYQFRKILISDEVQNEIDLQDCVNESDLKRMIFFCNPFKWYDSFAYSERYNYIDDVCILSFNPISLKRSDVLRLNYNGKLYYGCLKADNITVSDYLYKNKKNNDIISLN